MVAPERPVWHLEGRHPLGLHLGSRLPEGQRLGLGEEVRHEQVLVVVDLGVGVDEADEVARNEPGALVDELVEGVLAVGARLSPHDRPGHARDRLAVERHRLAVALHVELLEVGGETRQVLAVREDRLGLGAEEVVVPEPDQTEQDGKVVVERRGAEVLVDGVEARKHLAEPIGPDGDHQ